MLDEKKARASRDKIITMEIDMTTHQWAQVQQYLKDSANELVNFEEGNPVRESFLYPIAKLAIAVDMELHKKADGICEPHEEGCGLLKNIESFKEFFHEEIAKDTGIKFDLNNKK